MKEVPLTKGRVALVDDEDYERIAQFRWYATFDGGRWYAMRSINKNGRTRQEQMHRVILGLKPGEWGDHINHDGLDNRQANLRRCTLQQNRANSRKNSGRYSSHFKGVTFYKRNQQWGARICVNGHSTFLGLFDKEGDAAAAYAAAAIQYYGEFACAEPQRS